MNRMLGVCFLVVTMVAGVGMFAIRQSPVRAAGQDLAMQRGVSVEMAPTKNASAMLEADDSHAWIITVPRDGAVYFGTDAVSPEGLLDRMEKTPRNRAAKLYVKADARAAFSSVQEVLSAAREDGFDDVDLLTAQAEPAQAGTIVHPKGLEVWIGTEAATGLVTVRVDSREGSTNLRINDEDVAPAELQARMGKLFDHRSERIVRLKAAGAASWGQVVEAIDACRGAGASRVVLSVAGI